MLSHRFARSALLSILLAGTALAASAKDVTITAWAGGTGEDAHYRLDNLRMAAKFLEDEEALAGRDLHVTVKTQSWSGWDDFKQAVTLAAESGSGPEIIVSGHEDIGPWSQAGLIRPIQDFVYFDSWPLNQIYPNLYDVATYNGVIWGIPQDAEARVMFFNRDALKAIGWSDAQIDALPERVEKGEYTLYDMLKDLKAEQDKGAIKPGMGFNPRPVNGNDYWQFYQSFGGEMQDPGTGRLELDTAALKGMYQFYADAAAMGLVSKTHLGTSWDDWHREVVNYQNGAWNGGTWHYAQWVGNMGMKDFFGKVQATLIPAGKPGVGRANSITHPLVYLLGAGNSDDAAQIAAQLITIASEPRLNALHAVASGHLAIGRDETGLPFYADDRWLALATERFLPYANSIPNDADFGTYWSAMYKGLQDAWTGTRTVDQAVSDVTAQVVAALGDKIEVK